MSATVPDTGVERIATAFERARADGHRAALMPYLMAGYPSLETTRDLLRSYVEAGADLIEFGLPFSDPLADGPVIHAAAVAALAGGARLGDCLEVAREVTGEVPVIAMGYVNPILAMGAERFCDRLVEVGICGLIVPDLPVEEADGIAAACAARGLALVPLVAPTSGPERMTRIGGAAAGFIYTVSVAGTTGERGPDAAVGYEELLDRVRGTTEVPVALGFGIATPEAAARAAAAGADGVIVGTRLVRAAGEHPPEAVGALVRAFAEALK